MKSSPARLKPFGHTGALTEDVEFSLKTVYHIFQLFFFFVSCWDKSPKYRIIRVTGLSLDL